MSPPHAAPGPSPALITLAALPRRELDRRFALGAGLSPHEVAGSTWRGWNISPAATLLLSRKFLKRFHPDGRGGENVLARQNALEGPWIPRFGGRGVLPFALARGSAYPGFRDDALVIDYGAPAGRSRWSPPGRVIDLLVRPSADHPDLLLGVGRLRIGGRARFLEHFLLQRLEPGH